MYGDCHHAYLYAPSRRSAICMARSLAESACACMRNRRSLHLGCSGYQQNDRDPAIHHYETPGFCFFATPLVQLWAICVGRRTSMFDTVRRCGCVRRSLEDTVSGT
jgi:hypothetical protein